MRKVILSFSLLLLVLPALTACKKAYACDCTFSYIVGGQTVNDTGLYEGEFNSKSQANESCQEWEDAYINTGASAADCVSSVK